MAFKIAAISWKIGESSASSHRKSLFRIKLWPSISDWVKKLPRETSGLREWLASFHAKLIPSVRGTSLDQIARYRREDTQKGRQDWKWWDLTFFKASLQKAFSLNCNHQNWRKAHKFSLSCLLGACLALLSLLHNAELDTLATGDGDPRLSTLSNSEHITHTSGKLVPCRICHVDDIKTSLMLLTMLNDTNTPSVSPTSNHDDVANVKFYELNHLACLKVDLDSVIRLDERIRVPIKFKLSLLELKYERFRFHETANFMLKPKQQLSVTWLKLLSSPRQKNN